MLPPRMIPCIRSNTGGGAAGGTGDGEADGAGAGRIGAGEVVGNPKSHGHREPVGSHIDGQPCRRCMLAGTADVTPANGSARNKPSCRQLVDRFSAVPVWGALASSARIATMFASSWWSQAWPRTLFYATRVACARGREVGSRR
jgi:hypothetical protein